MTFARMRWTNVVFLHWDVSPASIADWVPPWLELDVRRRRAFVGVVAMDAQGPALRMPFGIVGRLPSYSQVNVRTYVHGPQGSGIYLHRTSVGSVVAAAGARLLGQPYTPERAHVDVQGERVAVDAPTVSFLGSPVPGAVPAHAWDIERFLLERYVVYGELPGGIPYYVRVRHAPWLVRRFELSTIEPRIEAVRGLPPGGALLAEPVNVNLVGFAPELPTLRRAEPAGAET